ncbi:MAG TPA: acyl-CoA dehydrogenase family protein [Pseudonocardia sp.]|uniref:acyl-CoA dehydrogenase family protein n=1 Tax=Pseudonocardia sp. TaxID=60912 RepID=UPI002F3F5428
MSQSSRAVGHPLGPDPAEAHWVRAAAELAAGFAATAADLDERAELPVDNLRALHRAGLDAAVLPTERGGEGLSFRAFGEIVRLVSASCPSTGCVWLMHIGAAAGLVAMSPPDTAGFYAEQLRDGARFANALSEPTSGNMFLLPQQVAEPAPGGWVLTGAKRFVSGCEVADHLLINALVEGEPAFFGLAPDDTVSYLPIWDTMGLRASRSQLVTLHNTLLRADRRCVPTSEPNHIPVGLAFLSLGIADAAFEAMVEHARSRTIPTTGEPLSQMQWLRFDAAAAHLRLESAGLYAQHCAWLADQRSPAHADAALRAKPLANEVAQEVAQLAVRVGGGSGYLRTSAIQRHFRDAQAPALMAYSVEVCKDRIGTQLL